MLRSVKFLATVNILILLTSCSLLPQSTAEDEITSVDLVLTGEVFSAGDLSDVVSSPDGLTMAGAEVSGLYLSPIIDAPIDFNVLIPQWEASVPDSASMTIQMRTGAENGRWSEWMIIEENDDWNLPEETDIVGQMIAVPAVDVTHQKFQFSVSFSRYDGQAASILRTLRVTFIDSSSGPTAIEMAANQEGIDSRQPEGAEDGYPKPPVISREVWCTSPACSYSDGLEYEPVSHLIVHHTASSNTSSDWAAVVRAIWYFHTITRGWGDIGYNYLVDMNGVLYEGRLGGDDVVGTHAGGANAGTMALAFIGMFTGLEENSLGIEPTKEMLDSAVALLAWKADQTDIDVYDAGYLPNLEWGLPKLMGHRDVYGTTVCPGDKAYELLPWLREEVSRRIQFDSPYIYVDELSDAFTRGDANWYSPPGGCGFNGSSFYTWSTTDPENSTNWAEWRPNVPSSGVYEVDAYAPFCPTGQSETAGATYAISDINGSTTVTIDQEANLGTWMRLGTYNFAAGNSNVIRLSDLTVTDSGHVIWFDAIRLRRIDQSSKPAVANQRPAQGSWLQYRAVTFEWSAIDLTNAKETLLEVATDINFNNIVLSHPLTDDETTYTHAFNQDYALLFWKVRTTSQENQRITSQPTQFGIDTVAPSSKVQSIKQVEDGSYLLEWTGVDATSGVNSFAVEYWVDGDVKRTPWLTDTPDTSAVFVPPDKEVYWFVSQARDKAGTVELEHTTGDISTDQAVKTYSITFFPLISR